MFSILTLMPSVGIPLFTQFSEPEVTTFRGRLGSFGDKNIFWKKVGTQMFFQFPRASLGSSLYLWYLQYAFSLFHFHELVVNNVNPGSGWSWRSLDLEVSISPGRRAEILIAVTAGGYCLTRTCSRGGHTICRGAAKQLTNTTDSLQWSHPHLNSIFASKLHARDPLHWVICIRLIRWHGAHLQAVVTVMEILLPDPEILP